jgi:hypothetical protein
VEYVGLKVTCPLVKGSKRCHAASFIVHNTPTYPGFVEGLLATEEGDMGM